MSRLVRLDLDVSKLNGQSVEAIHDRLRDAILRGALSPGQQMPQVHLARHLGVSRTPLREALRLLQREGLVDVELNRRVRVAGFSLVDLEELYCLRLVLEASAVQLTVPRMVSEEVAELEAAMARMAHFADAEDYERWEVPHRAFHAGLTSKAGARMRQLLSQLSDHAERYRRLYTLQREGGWQRGVVDHRRILDAFKERDADAAARRLVAHLARTPLSVIDMVEASYEPDRLREVLVGLIGTHEPPGEPA